MKKYVSLKCGTCARQKDQLIDLTHYTPDRCTITLTCEGRLFPVGYTSDGSTLLGVPPTGVTNWYPRGSTITTPTAIKNDALYDTSTGEKQQLVIAVSNAELGYTPGNQAQLTLNLLAEQQVAKDYRQYTYRRSGTITVLNGVEDAQAKKVLRYNITGSTPDQVEVYVNGVKRNLGLGADEYQLYDGTISSPVPLNSVLFNTAVTGSSTQFDVIVTKATVPSTLSITFSRATDDESRVGTGAWEGVDSVQSPAVTEHSLFFSDFSEIASTISLDVKLRLDTTTPSFVKNVPAGSPTTLTPAGMNLLLSRTKVHTAIDRQRSKWISFDALHSSTGYLIVKLLDGVRSMLVTEGAASDLFPILEVNRFDAPTLMTAEIGDDDSAELDNSIITGPDA